MSGFNQAILLGRLCALPEELTTKGGKLFLKAVIATSVHQKNSDGVSEERTNFVPVTIFGRTAEVFLKYIQKGDMVNLVGRLDSNEWKTDSGEKRLSLSFVVEQLNLLPKRARQANGGKAMNFKSESKFPQICFICHDEISGELIRWWGWNGYSDDSPGVKYAISLHVECAHSMASGMMRDVLEGRLGKPAADAWYAKYRRRARTEQRKGI